MQDEHPISDEARPGSLRFGTKAALVRPVSMLGSSSSGRLGKFS